MVKRDVRIDKVKKNFYITLLILIVVLTTTYIYTRPLKVIEVVEGNILVLNNGKKIGLIGVDTDVHADTFIRKMGKGEGVRLKYDERKLYMEGHILAYVYLLDGTFLNAEIIKQGYARVNKKFPFMYIEEFKHYEKEARKNKRGIWSD